MICNLQIAKETAITAGGLLKEQYFQQKIQINIERGRDIKLQSDLDAEKIIINSLINQTDFSILSEEAGLIQGNSNEYTWIVDPLDGSLNFSRGIKMNCISIGLWKNRKPVLGVIYDFISDEMFEGICGKAAYLNGHSICVSQIAEVNKSIICTGFPVYRSFEDSSLFDFLKTIQSFKKVRLLGSAAISLALVAKGSVEAYAEEGIALWDVAAGIALVEAAGGKCDFSFCEESKNHLNIVATNGKIKYC